MSAREAIAYAITYAPRGQKGGPYEGPCGIGRPVPTLAEAWRKRTRATVRRWLRAVRAVVPHARVIRIVRARPSAEPTPQPSEASAVEVLRELVAWSDNEDADTDDVIRIATKARRVLAAAGPDPSEVVRAAIREVEAEEAFDLAAVRGRGVNAEADAISVARRIRAKAVDAYRKAGGK